MDFDINDVASIGSVRDTPSYMLPPEAWTLALNMRAVDGGLESLLGWEQIFGTPGTPPHFAMPIVTASTVFWIYVSLTKAYGYDGTSHTNITRQTAGVDVNYTANDTPDWSGTILNGVPILNNGIDVPQYWPTISLATKVADLVNWPATLRAKVVRAFGPFLVAFYLTDTGVALPHLVQWSHPADPGSVPSSWDYTDPTKDAGRTDLPDVNSGTIVDALPLGQIMYIYKESSIWKMRYIGGRSIFDFGQSAWITTIGLLARRCVTVIGDGTRQVFASQEDICWHNGSEVQSILNKRQRRRLFNEIDTTNYAQSFIFDNPFYKEVWFCYPTSGNTYPNVALVLNYSDPNRWVVTEADGITFRYATQGRIESPSDEDWEATEELWDDDTGAWSELQRRRVVLLDPTNTRFYNMDKGTLRHATAFSTTLRREGLAVIGKKQNGQLIVDWQQMKMLKGIWPKISGGPVSIRLGAQQYVDGPTLWGTAATFTPATDAGRAVPGPVSGRSVSVEYMSSSTWRIDGYKAEVVPLGKFGPSS